MRYAAGVLLLALVTLFHPAMTQPTAADEGCGAGPFCATVVLDPSQVIDAR